MDCDIEDTVDLNKEYPSVVERYWTKYYFIPNDKKKAGSEGGDAKGDSEAGSVTWKEGMDSACLGKGDVGGIGESIDSVDVDRKVSTIKEENLKMEADGENVDKIASGIGTCVLIKAEDVGSVNDGNRSSIDQEKGGNVGSGKMKSEPILKEEEKMEDNNTTTTKVPSKDTLNKDVEHRAKYTYSSLNTSGHVCVMLHTNKLCLVALSPKHPALAQGQTITEVSYNVGKFNRLDNQVSGKGKRGAQMIGPQSIVCIITCADGTRHGVLAGVHGKLIEVNERLLSNPQLVSERTDSEGYLAIILPPIRKGDAPLNRLISSEEYWAMDHT